MILTFEQLQQGVPGSLGAPGKEEMRVRRNRKSAGLLAAVAATSLVLAACAEEGNGEDGETAAPGDGQVLEGEEITIAMFGGWEEGIAATYLWKAAFESQGATVTVEVGDVEPVYTGVADGTWDIGFDAWLPDTHAPNWESHPELVDLGAWFEEAPLTLAVNEDAPIQSLTELADAADEFDNRIVGIDAGAGLTRTTQEQVIPTYGLEDMEFIISSTAAMLTELEGAIDRGDNVVVTLWQPHWAYDAFPIRNLEDPEGALGDPQSIHSFARPGFEEDFPEAAEWVSGWTFSADELHGLENIMFNENEAESEEEYEESVQQWLDQNPDYLEQLTGA
jgi:glycine betaine/proline transport system substrate-binding protein